MNGASDLLASVNAFIDAGGGVMWAILAVSVVLWALIVERFLFFYRDYPGRKRAWLAEWNARADRHSWFAHRIREAFIAQARIDLGKTVPLIRMLIVLCPMLGLLGTVLGMMDVFDVMKVTGSSNARAMADGVSNATVTTMAGLVIAISGLYFARRIETWVEDETHHLSDLLQFD